DYSLRALLDAPLADDVHLLRDGLDALDVPDVGGDADLLARSARLERYLHVQVARPADAYRLAVLGEAFRSDHEQEAPRGDVGYSEAAFLIGLRGPYDCLLRVEQRDLRVGQYRARRVAHDARDRTL